MCDGERMPPDNVIPATPEGAPLPFGASEFGVEVGVDAGTVAEVEAFRRLLEEWNSRMNLVGPSALPEFWRRHAFDSAQLLHVEQSASVWADVGAGAGFPGLVLAILMKGRPGACVHLIESMAKRIRFLDAVASALNLPVVLHHARAETVQAPAGLQVVTARACAPFRTLLGYSHQLFSHDVQGLFLKGRDAPSELTEARQEWTFDADLTPSRSDPSGYIVRIERLAIRGR